MPPRLYNNVGVLSSTVGLGPIAIGAAVDGTYRTFSDASVADGVEVPLTILDGGEVEQSVWSYDETAQELTFVGLRSSTTGSRLSLSGNARLLMSAMAEDVQLVVACASVAEIAALDPAVTKFALLYGAGGRNGMFAWNSANVSTKVSADTVNGVYIAPATAPTGASGAWERVFDNKISVAWFGATGIITDTATTAFQKAVAVACLTAGGGKTVWVPGGYHKLTASIIVPASAQGVTIKGEGQTRSRLYRTTDYGSTFVLGSTSDAAIESTVFEDLNFWHDYGGYENGQPASTLVNKPTIGAHIWCYNPIRFSIRRCNLWNMPSNITILGGAKGEIVSCGFRGSWDHAETQAQVTAQSVLLQVGHAASSNALPTDIHIRDNDFAGYLSPSRSVTYGTWSGNISENVGPQCAVRILASEVVQISGGNIGGHNDAGISIQPQDGVACLSVKVSGVFFDGNRLAGIRVTNGNGTSTLNGLSVADNIFIGQANSDGAIWIGNATTDTVASATGVMIKDNKIGNFVKSAITLLRSVGVAIDSNIIHDFNTKAGFMNDLGNAAGIYVGAGTHITRIKDNLIGGGFGFENYAGAAPNASQYGIVVVSGATEYDVAANTIPAALVNVAITTP